MVITHCVNKKIAVLFFEICVDMVSLYSEWYPPWPCDKMILYFVINILLLVGPLDWKYLWILSHLRDLICVLHNYKDNDSSIFFCFGSLNHSHTIKPTYRLTPLDTSMWFFTLLSTKWAQHPKIRKNYLNVIYFIIFFKKIYRSKKIIKISTFFYSQMHCSYAIYKDRCVLYQ